MKTPNPPPDGALLVNAPVLPPYDLGPGHPFAVWRLEPMFDLIRGLDLAAQNELLVPEAATDDVLATAHDVSFVDTLRAVEAGLGSDGDDQTLDRGLAAAAAGHGLGVGDNPLAPGQHAGASAAVGGTVACVDAVMEGRARRAFNPKGGLHHAMQREASGFCLYNDLVVGIRRALERGAERVTYVDFDVHHGDGVERAFAGDPRVQTISFHEDPSVRWPFSGRIEERGHGPGRGYAINVPFASGTTDASWQRVVRGVLDAAVGGFAPDLLVTQHGCDTHLLDPLADLSLGTASALMAAELSRDLADAHCGGRWVATGGGGYRPASVLARAWTLVWIVLSGRDVPDALPAGWHTRWRETVRQEGGSDGPVVDPPSTDRRQDVADSANSATLDRLAAVHGW